MGLFNVVFWLSLVFMTLNSTGVFAALEFQNDPTTNEPNPNIIIDDNGTPNNDDDDKVYTRSGAGATYLTDDDCPARQQISISEGNNATGERTIPAENCNAPGNSVTTQIAIGNAPEGEIGGLDDLSCWDAIPVLGWIVCGVITFMVGAVEGVLSFILGGDDFSNLTVQFGDERNASNANDEGLDGLDFTFDPAQRDQLDDASTRAGGVRATWQAFRTIARITFVFAFLYMVYAVTVSNSNAYGLKRLAPRLILAFILVEASFFLSRFAVSLSNNAGIALAQMFDNFIFDENQNFSPAALLSTGDSFGGDPESWVNDIFTNGLIVGGAVVAGIAAGSTLLLTLGGALITLIVVYFVFIFRQLVILILVAVSPLAAIAWIHPQTDGLAKAWWQTFSKTLLMFPIIVLLLKFGELMARTTSTDEVQDGANEGAFNLVRFVAYLAPFFLIPFTFRFAGGAIAQVAGMSERAAGGILQNRKRLAAERDADRVRRTGERIRGGQVFKGAPEDGGGLRSRINRGAAAASNSSWRDLSQVGKKTIDASGDEVSVARSRREARQAVADAKAEQVAMESDELKVMGVQSENLLALAGGKEAAEEQVSKLQEKQAVAEASLAEGYEMKRDEATGGFVRKTDDEGNFIAVDEAAALDAVAKGQASEAKYARAVAWAESKPRTDAERRGAAQALMRTGYEVPEGEQGYEFIRGIAMDLAGVAPQDRTATGIPTGPKAGDYIRLMNGMQYAAGQGGRFDLAGINDGAYFDPKKGFDKASTYELGKVKGDAITALQNHVQTLQYEVASGVSSRNGAQLNQEQISSRQMEIAVTYKELGAIAQGATGGVRDEAIKAMQVIASRNDAASISLPSGASTVSIPRQVTETVEQQVVVNGVAQTRITDGPNGGKVEVPVTETVVRVVQDAPKITIRDILSDITIDTESSARSRRYGEADWNVEGQAEKRTYGRGGQQGDPIFDDDGNVIGFQPPQQ